MQSPLKTTLALLLILCIGMWAMGGKIRYAINPIARQMLLQEFIQSTRKNGDIDVESFWEFRDFFSATTAVFTPDAIAQDKPFLTLQTPYITSHDYMRKNPNIDDIPLDTSVDQLLFQSSDALIYRANNVIVITFHVPPEAMLKANGYFRYYGVDLSRYPQWQWFNYTTITL